MGDSIIVEGIDSDVDGIYVIKDVTSKRVKNTIDILVRKGKLKGVWKCKIKKL